MHYSPKNPGTLLSTTNKHMRVVLTNFMTETKMMSRTSYFINDPKYLQNELRCRFCRHDCSVSDGPHSVCPPQLCQTSYTSPPELHNARSQFHRIKLILPQRAGIEVRVEIA